MAKGYWVARVDVDATRKATSLYAAANAAHLQEIRRKFLVRGGKFETVEGSSRTRNVVIEFPNYEAALACYNSPEYQANIKLRDAAADRRHHRHRGL